jgi:hypothetical protein
MDIKHILLSTLITTTAFASSVSADENDSSFKLAIVKDYLGSRSIALGHYVKGINYLTRKNTDNTSFESKMGLCTAYIKISNVDKSESACTSAINDLKSIKTDNKQVTYIKSVSYSNRGVSRYLNNDIAGAIDDLTTAVLIDSNPITTHNLKLAKYK